MPITGGLFAAGMVALVGLPPFGLFVSKLALLRAGFATGHAWLMAIVLAFLAVAFISLIGHLNRMLNGAPPAGVAIGEGGRWALVPLGPVRARARAARRRPPRAGRDAARPHRRDHGRMKDLGALSQDLARRLDGRLADARVVRGRELHCRIEPGDVGGSRRRCGRSTGPSCG